MKNLKWIIGAAAIFTFISCNSTRVISSYKDEKITAKDYKKILVLGIFQQKERSLRQEAETQLVNKLKNQGYNAVSAMEDFGPKAFQKIISGSGVISRGINPIIYRGIIPPKPVVINAYRL